jgi:hypothetical protein
MSATVGGKVNLQLYAFVMSQNKRGYGLLPGAVCALPVGYQQLISTPPLGTVAWPAIAHTFGGE